MTNKIELYSEVLMKTENIPGVLLEVFTGKDGREYATVESRVEYSQEGSSERWPVYYVPIDDIEPITE